MKKFLAILILIFSLQTPSQANDIRDFQIEGMSIGDSALDYFSESRIKQTMRTDFPKSKKFSRSFGLKLSNMTTYDNVMINFKTNDKKYKIAAISGAIVFKNNIKDCYPKKNNIASEIMKQFSDLKNKSQKKKHSLDNKSLVDVTYIYFKRGIIEISCYDWTNKIEKERGYEDHLKVALYSEEFRQWLDNEAY